MKMKKETIMEYVTHLVDRNIKIKEYKKSEHIKDSDKIKNDPVYRA